MTDPGLPLVGISKLGLLVYFVGFVLLNAMVAKGCSDPRCIHGWYSKETGVQRGAVLLWLGVFPIAEYGIRILVRRLTGEEARDGDLERRRADERRRDAHWVEYYTGSWQVLQAKGSAIATNGWHCEGCKAPQKSGSHYFYEVKFFGQISSRTKYCSECRRTAEIASKSTVSQA